MLTDRAGVCSEALIVVKFSSFPKEQTFPFLLFQPGEGTDFYEPLGSISPATSSLFPFFTFVLFSFYSAPPVHHISSLISSIPRSV